MNRRLRFLVCVLAFLHLVPTSSNAATPGLFHCSPDYYKTQDYGCDWEQLSDFMFGAAEQVYGLSDWDCYIYFQSSKTDYPFEWSYEYANNMSYVSGINMDTHGYGSSGGSQASIALEFFATTTACLDKVYAYIDSLGQGNGNFGAFDDAAGIGITLRECGIESFFQPEIQTGSDI